MEIDYKYNEDKAIKELSDYIDGTYGQHYSKNKFQATEFIIDGGHGWFLYRKHHEVRTTLWEQKWFQSCRLDEGLTLCNHSITCT